MTVRGKPKRGGTVRRGDGEAGRGRGRGRGGHDGGYGSNTQEEEEVTCQCSQPAARRIVQKEGVLLLSKTKRGTVWLLPVG
jgi:hypothetical protein